MPAKKGKKGKKKKAKVPKKVPGTGEMPDIMVKRFLKVYENNCLENNTIICPEVRKTMKDCVDNMKLFVKAVMQPTDLPVPPDPLPGQDPSELEPPPNQVALEPFLNAMRKERYTWLKALYVWQLPLHYSTMATLGALLEKQIYKLTTIELTDCLLDHSSVERLARGFNECSSLTSVNLDYNEFGDEGCWFVCKGLEGNTSITSLSLCYCSMTSRSGESLGGMVATTAVRDLYLDGNDLECAGVIELIKACAFHAQTEHFEREEKKALKEQQAAEAKALESMEEKTTGNSADAFDNIVSGSRAGSAKGKKKKGKKKKGKKKKKKEPEGPPPVGPWLHKLHLADNGIDSFGVGAQFSPVICMRKFRELIGHSLCLQELDLEDNLVGDIGGRELLDGLKERKDNDLPSLKIRTTHRMQPETFAALIKHGAGLAKKKKKGKKKKKK